MVHNQHRSQHEGHNRNHAQRHIHEDVHDGVVRPELLTRDDSGEVDSHQGREDDCYWKDGGVVRLQLSLHAADVARLVQRMLADASEGLLARKLREESSDGEHDAEPTGVALRCRWQLLRQLRVENRLQESHEKAHGQHHRNLGSDGGQGNGRVYIFLQEHPEPIVPLETLGRENGRDDDHEVDGGRKSPVPRGAGQIEGQPVHLWQIHVHTQSAGVYDRAHQKHQHTHTLHAGLLGQVVEKDEDAEAQQSEYEHLQEHHQQRLLAVGAPLFLLHCRRGVSCLIVRACA